MLHIWAIVTNDPTKNYEWLTTYLATLHFRDLAIEIAPTGLKLVVHLHGFT